LIEVIIALFVITVGLAGTLNVIQQITGYNKILSSRLVGIYLAQEGVEIVRNIRDTNWLENETWDYGLDPSDYEAQYDDSSLSPYAGRLFHIKDGSYKYAADGIVTSYKRKITLSNVDDYKLVSVFIEWDGGTVNLNERLYNWLGQ